MELRVAGTPEEVKAFLASGDTTVAKVAYKVDVNNEEANKLMERERWSDSQHGWVKINAMNPYHLVNAIRQEMNGENAGDLFDKNDTFRAMILCLAQDIKDDLLF